MKKKMTMNICSSLSSLVEQQEEKPNDDELLFVIIFYIWTTKRRTKQQWTFARHVLHVNNKKKNKTTMTKCLSSSSTTKQQEKENWNLNYLGGSKSYLLGLELAMELMWWSSWQVVMVGGDGVNTMEFWATNLDMMVGLLELLELPWWHCKPRTTKDGRRFAREGRGEWKGVGRFVNGFEEKKKKKAAQNKSDDFFKTARNETGAGVVCQPNVGGWSPLHAKQDWCSHEGLVSQADFISHFVLLFVST